MSESSSQVTQQSQAIPQTSQLPSQTSQLPSQSSFPTFQLIVIWIQSVIATLGSLYYGRYGDPIKTYQMGVMFMSEFAYPPCQLCRFARILMYPIVIISFMGLVMKDRQSLKYTLALSVLGIILESYQYFIQMTSTPEEIEQGMCGGLTGSSCAAVDVIYLGFITIPFLCLVAFIVITIFAGWGLMKNTPTQQSEKIISDDNSRAV